MKAAAILAALAAAPAFGDDWRPPMPALSVAVVQWAMINCPGYQVPGPIMDAAGAANGVMPADVVADALAYAEAMVAVKGWSRAEACYRIGGMLDDIAARMKGAP